MHNKIGKKAFIITIGFVVVIAIPILIILLLSNENITNFIENDLKITKGQAIEYILTFISIAIPFLLGIVVYLQSQRINDLESTQYNTFIAIEDVDYSWELSDYLFYNNLKNKFYVSHVFSSSHKFLLTSINLCKDNTGKSLIIPLACVTKNNPLIVELEFQSVDVILRNDKIEILNKKLHNESPTIVNTILKDDSRFVLGFGMTVSNECLFNEIDLKFSLSLKDQNGNKNKFLLEVTLNKGNKEPTFYLSSSKTIQK